MTALPNAGRVCQTCKHCDTGSVTYECHKPPIGIVRGLGGWRRVHPTGWCGEHEWSQLHKPTAQAEVT